MMTIRLTLLALFMGSAVSAAFASEADLPQRGTLALRLAADREVDAAVAALAEARPFEVLLDGKAIALWHPVDERMVPTVEADPQLVVRSRAEAPDVMEMLLLVGSDDITHADLARVYPSTDRLGLPVVGFELVPEGAERFGNLTGAHIGRVLPIVLNGEVIAAPRIQTRVTTHAIITGDFTTREVQVMVSELSVHARDQMHEASYGALEVRAVLWLIGGLLIAVVVLLGLLPVRGLEPPVSSRHRAVVGAIIGGVAGAWVLGLSREEWSPPPEPGIMTVGVQYHFSLIWGLLGLLAGGAMGYFLGNLIPRFLSRVVHNLKRLTIGVPAMREGHSSVPK